MLCVNCIQWSVCAALGCSVFILPLDTICYLFLTSIGVLVTHDDFQIPPRCASRVCRVRNNLFDKPDHYRGEGGHTFCCLLHILPGNVSTLPIQCCYALLTTASDRSSSPIAALTATALAHTCQCILAAAAPSTSVKCTKTYYQALEKEYSDVASFCKFYDAK